MKADFILCHTANRKQPKAGMKSISAVFVLQLILLVQPHLGRKHYLVEVESDEVKGHDYQGLSKQERCEGLKKLCEGRPTCLETIKCDQGGSEASNHYNAARKPYGSEDNEADEEYQGDGQKQHKELETVEFEHKGPNSTDANGADGANSADPNGANPYK